MATIKVYSVDGVKELSCFDTLSEVPFLTEDSYPLEDGLSESDEVLEDEE